MMVNCAVRLGPVRSLGAYYTRCHWRDPLRKKQGQIPQTLLGKEHSLSAWQAMQLLPARERASLPEAAWRKCYEYFCVYPDTRGPLKEDFAEAEAPLYRKLLFEFRRLRRIRGIPDDPYRTLDLGRRYEELRHIPGISLMPESAYRGIRMPCLHRSYGVKVCFECLVSALKKKKAYEAAMWMGCISHWILDVCSIGHCPIVFGWCDFFREGWLELRTTDGSYLPEVFLPISEITEPVRRKWAYHERLVTGYKPMLLATSVGEAAWLSACKAQALQEYAFGMEEVCLSLVIAGKRADSEMTLLAALAAKAQADIFHTAFRLARGRARANRKRLSPHIEDAIKGLKKPLRFHLCYKGVVPKRHKLPAVAVLAYHPIDNYLIETGNIHFYTRVVLSALAGLRPPYELLGPDGLTDAARFNAGNYPVAILPTVCDTYWRTYRKRNDCVRAIVRYLGSGGTLIAIGGKPFSRALDYASGFWLNMGEADNAAARLTSMSLENRHLPVNQLEGASLLATGESRRILRGVESKIPLRKNIGYIWDYVRYPTAFRRDAKRRASAIGNLFPLFELVEKDGIERATASAIIEYHQGGRFIYLPQYFLVPTVFSSDTIIERKKSALLTPAMDAVPRRVLTTVIKHFTRCMHE